QCSTAFDNYSGSVLARQNHGDGAIRVASGLVPFRRWNDHLAGSKPERGSPVEGGCAGGIGNRIVIEGESTAEGDGTIIRFPALESARRNHDGSRHDRESDVVTILADIHRFQI